MPAICAGVLGVKAWFTANSATLAAATNTDTIGVVNEAKAVGKNLTVKWYNEGGSEITGSTKATPVNPSVQELEDINADQSDSNKLGLYTYYYDGVAKSEVRSSDQTIKKSAFATFAIETGPVESASYQGTYKLTVQTSANSKIRINASDDWETAVALNADVVLGYMHISSAGVVSYHATTDASSAIIDLKIFYAVEPITRTNTESGSDDYGSISLKIGD